MAEGPPGGRDRFQLRLADLAMVVLGSAYVLDVARRSMAAWGGGWPDPAHALGLIVLTMAVGLILIEGGQGARRLLERLEPPRAGRGWGLAWRGLSVVGLGWLAIEGSRALEVDRASMAGSMAVGLHAEMRLRVIPLATTIGMIGLVLATGPSRARRSGRSGRSWPSVLLAGLAAPVIVGVGYAWAPYLILLALEAVRNALNRLPPVPHPSLFDRLARAGFEALPGLLACLATAIWIGEDLRAAARDPIRARAARSWAGVLGRLSTASLAAAGAGYVLMVSIPRLNPHLAEAIGAMIDPSTISAIALGFMGLAAGLAARPAALLARASDLGVPESADRWPGVGPWPGRIASGFACILLFAVIAAAIQAIVGDPEERWYIPIRLSNLLELMRAMLLGVSFARKTSGSLPVADPPSDFLLMASVAWLAIRLTVLVAWDRSGRPAPIDALGADRLALGRFLGWWAGLTALMLASLPILTVTGVALAHFVIGWVAG